MLAFQVVQRAISVQARVPGALSLSCSIIAHPNCTKPAKLPSRKLVYSGPEPLLSTFSGLAKSAKTSKKLLEWFPAINVGKDLFEINKYCIISFVAGHNRNGSYTVMFAENHFFSQICSMACSPSLYKV